MNDNSRNEVNEMCQKALALLTSMLIVLGSIGCECPVKVQLHNKTFRSIRVQLAIPWPIITNPLSKGSQFEFTLRSGHSWSTMSAKNRDIQKLALKGANGVILVRLLDARYGQWHTFAVVPDGVLDLRDYEPIGITIQLTNESKISVAALSKNGDVIPIEEHDDGRWFE